MGGLATLEAEWSIAADQIRKTFRMAVCQNNYSTHALLPLSLYVHLSDCEVQSVVPAATTIHNLTTNFSVSAPDGSDNR